jgi:hypothetical protein
MAEKRENSVLFSLRELQQIEEQRVTEEEDSRRRAEEERVRAQMEAERQRREAEEAARRAQADEERRRYDEQERRQRDDQLRLEEAERRARVEAQAKLEQQRLHMEMEVKRTEAERKSPKLLIGISVGLVLLVGGLGVFLYQQKQEAAERDRLAQAEIEKLNEKIGTALADIERLTQEKEAEYQKLLAARTEQDKAEAQRAIQAKDAELQSRQRALKQLRDQKRTGGGGSAAEKPKIKKPDCDPNDPLCGLE